MRKMCPEGLDYCLAVDQEPWYSKGTEKKFIPIFLKL